MKSLYVTHYGILEPLGQSQILPYLLGLSARGWSIQIISFEKPEFYKDRVRVEAQRKLLSQAGIVWHPRPYARGQSLFQVLQTILVTSAEIRRRHNSLDLIHCRAHVPCVMAWLGAAGLRTPFIFDFRGFMAEEYVDAGLWKPAGFRFRMTKGLEKMLLKRCNALIVLTEAACEHMRRHYSLALEKIFVIPCCADLSRYASPIPAQAEPANGPLHVVYSGSTSGRYDLPAMLSFFLVLLAKRPGSHFTILSTGDLSDVRAILQRSALPSDAVSALQVRHEDIPRYLTSQDLGLILLKGNLALTVASPTKVGEYLASGLVVAAEESLGDLQQILVDSGAGCLLNSQKPETWEAAANKALSLCNRRGFRENSRMVARRHFDLNVAIQKYAEAYEFASKGKASGACRPG
jgi:glycosyltransferase involved in cell wall biosynthesis